MDKVNIICMKWGTKFSADYVNRLHSMVSRNLNLPHRFVCFTDDDSGIEADIEVQNLPKIELPDRTKERGWQKLAVFAEGFGGLSGATLFLDLDVVIVDNIDDFFRFDGDFLIAHDKKNPHKLEGNSSVFRFEIGKYPQILSNFEQNFSTIKTAVRHEQAYLSREMLKLDKLNFWDDSWVPSFKYRCCPSWLKSWVSAPFIPENAKIIIFHGLPNPPDAIRGISGKWYRHIQPATWIEDYWF